LRKSAFFAKIKKSQKISKIGKKVFGESNFWERARGIS
jgi:hypothetical protein